MNDFLLYLLLVVVIANVAGFLFAIVFGGTETFQAIDEKMAKWIRGERSE